MGDLAEDLRLENAGGRYRGTVSPDWVVWTPNGGFLASLALRAAGTRSVLPRPAAISCHYLNVPAVGEVELEAVPLRSSARAESLRVSMWQGDRRILEAMVWTAVEQPPGFVHDLGGMPSIAPPEQMSPWTPPDDEPARDDVLPLWRNIDARLEGWPNGQAWEQRRAGAPVRREWCRFRPRATFEDPFVDAARALILLDTLMFPAALMAHPEPMTHFAPSLDLAVWLHRPASDAEWLLCETASPVAEDGLVGGSGRLWTRDGRLVATGGQQMLERPVAGAARDAQPDHAAAAS